jgi:hypothetical protein
MSPSRSGNSLSREAPALAAADWRPHASRLPESCSEVLCIDPGRLGFQIDPPAGRIRERLRADAEIYYLSRSWAPEPGAR